MAPFLRNLHGPLADLADYHSVYAKERIKELGADGTDETTELIVTDELYTISKTTFCDLEAVMSLRENNDVILQNAGLRDSARYINDRMEHLERHWDPRWKIPSVEKSMKVRRHDKKTMDALSMLLKSTQARQLTFVGQHFHFLHTDLEGLVQKVMDDTDQDVIENLPLHRLKNQLEITTDLLHQYNENIESLMVENWTEQQQRSYAAAEGSENTDAFYRSARERYMSMEFIQKHGGYRGNALRKLVVCHMVARKARAGIRSALESGLPEIQERFIMSLVRRELDQLLNTWNASKKLPQ